MSTTNKENTDYWIPDTDTYIAIQKLIPFVEFVATLQDVTVLQFQKAEEIILLIKNIDNPEIKNNWCVCLDIFDHEVQNGYPEKQGNYWRKWWVFFEMNTLEIEADTANTADHRGHYGNDFYFWGSINFKKQINCERKYMDKDISEFINDAMNYKNYINQSLKEIEIDIDIW